MARVRLRDIRSPGERAAVMGLRRGPGQDQYLDSMEEIFAEVDEEQRAMPRPWAVHDAETGALRRPGPLADVPFSQVTHGLLPHASREAVDEQPAIQVVHLVLDAAS